METGFLKMVMVKNWVQMEHGYLLMSYLRFMITWYLKLD